MIPKIIHYCWFGHNPLPEDVIKCIESWKKFCPDYEIKQWDESNFDISKRKYTREAYDQKKYAFVSDVARLEIVAQNGGIYLDTDVELIKSLDEMLHLDAFVGIESGVDRIATGLGFGATKNHPVFEANLDAYNSRSFMVNGKPDLTTCTSITKNVFTKIFGQILVKKEPITKSTVNGNRSVTILPQDFMAPYNLETNKLKITDRTLSIHHYNATWKSKKDKFLRIKIKIRRLLGDSLYEKLKNMK